MNRAALISVSLGLLLGAGVAGLAGCGSPAEAKPLDVTYYYLPG